MRIDEKCRNEARAYGEWWQVHLGLRFREARLAAGLTGYGVEARSGVARETIRKLERGEIRIAITALAQLARAVDTTVTRLLRGMDRIGPLARKKFSRPAQKKTPARRKKRRG